jgi:peptide/nickel transport system substrate-binding protein
MYQRSHRILFLVSILLLSTMALSQPSTVLDPQGRSWASSPPYDTLVEATLGWPESLDPALDYETAGTHVLAQVYEPLVGFNRSRMDESIPMLATAWTVSPDGKTYTFTTRQGVQFHDGSSLTADDVAYTFQRGLLQGGTLSPQWLLTEPFFGVGIYDIAELVDPSRALDDDPEALAAADPDALRAACERVTSVIVADDTSGTVTMTLDQAWGPFLATIAQPWGSILDRDWAINHGAWNDDCGTWQNYYAPDPSEAPFRAIANGTGPFMLDQWEEGSEIVLVRNPNYWRQEPMWTDGPMGLAAIARVEIRTVPDAATAVAMLQDGTADLASVPPDYRAALEPLVMMSYPDPDGLVPTLINPSGVLRSYPGGLSTQAADAFFNYDIVTDGTRDYIGSGTLNGYGIPPDFFTDIHVRKAFSYAFDWDQYISRVFGGDAIQRRGPIISGILGYSRSQPTYSHNPELAMQEFSQAWEGQVAAVGFTLTLAYNEGNTARQAFCEILRDGIEALDPRFHVNVVAPPWPDFLEDLRGSRLPIFVAGWLQDIPHPHNWVVAYLLGTYANWQGLPAVQRDAYRADIDTCVALSGDAAQQCYEDIQNDTYLNATDIFLAQGIRIDYVRAEIRGYYSSMADFGGFGAYFYALSKGPPPVVGSVTPTSDQSIDFSSAGGSTGTVALPAGTVAQEVRIAVTPDVVVYDAPSGYLLGSLSFEVQAYATDGTVVPNLTLNTPATITIHYTPEAIDSLDELSLRLFRWNGSVWEDAACGDYVRDTVNDALQVPVCDLSEFALAGPRAVVVDIKPGSDPNTINCRNRNGVIPVAVLSTPEFDATTIDANTVRFGPSGAQETHRDRSGNARRQVEDINGDGLDDLVFDFRYGETGLTCVDEWAVLTGGTYGRVGIVGRDSIRNTRN